MPKKYSLFGKKFEWYDVKTKIKKLLRGITYTWLVQKIICQIIILYMWIVYLTSKKEFFNESHIKKCFEEKSIILSTWHNRLMLIPFYARYVNKKIRPTSFMTLASKHGDGRFVGEVMKKFNFKNIYGSSQNNRKESRGIDTSALRSIIKGLKAGVVLGITPDGPRGPNQKINGAIVNIAKISGAKILPISYSSSRYIQFRSWDNFRLPLPFSKIVFYTDKFFDFNEKDDEAKLNKELEKRMNIAQKRSMEKIKK